MVDFPGPQLDVLALQEIDFPLFAGLEQFAQNQRGFDWRPLAQDGKDAAAAKQKTYKDEYQPDKKFKVKDFPFVVYKTDVVEMDCLI